MKRLRVATVAAAAAMIAGLLAIPASAQAPAKRTETVEIRKIVHDGPGKPGDGEAMMESCPGQVIDLSSSAGSTPDRKDEARIKLCLQPGTTAEMATRLEKVIADMEGDEMNPAVKADLKAQLTAKIAELRAAR